MTPVLWAFAENQPITHIIEAIRALMLGMPTGNHVWISVVWCLAILVVSMVVALWLFRRKTTQ